MNNTASILGRRTLGILAASLMLVATGMALLHTGKISAAACALPATDYGRATNSVNVTNSGTYRIWSRVFAPNTTNNSYLLEIDGNTCFTVGDNAISPNAWTWIDYHSANPASKIQQSLSAGNHTLKMIGREPGVKLGRILLVSDLNCVPTGNGDNCATSAPSTDKEAPTIDITSPADGSSVKDSVNVAANAKDNGGVAKVEFYINGLLRHSDTSAPYFFTWDTKVTANGRVSITAKAYDTASNVGSDSIQVTVTGGDSKAPTAPSGVTAASDAAGKVTVKWNASTDNVAVTGYRVLRNNVSVAQVTDVTEYIDSTTLPSTDYTYQISAYDAAGNSSALSNEAKIKTPNRADAQAPSAPENLKAEAINSSQVNLTWNASTDNIGVAAYEVFRATGKDKAIKVATVTSTSYGDTNLKEKTKYSYYVVARDIGLNISNKSTTVTIETKTKPAAGTGTLVGQVVFTKNNPRHAHVLIRVKGIKHSFDTDQKGNYEITNLPPGTYKVIYQANGSHNKEVTVKIQAGKAQTQNVTLLKR